jgi:putative redox protein
MEDKAHEMEDKAHEKLEENLEGYKEKILEVNRGSLEWEKDLIFNARTQMGYEVEFDANLQWGCSPTETLLMSVAGCMAIDVFYFLKKMRADNITEKKIDRAIALSHDKYCSVYNSLRDDIEVTVKYTINGEKG